ncbi:MAG: hypothetical protein ACXWVK_01630 [Rhodoplanes sp.]
MQPTHFIRAGAKALVARTRGPTLYDVCDPLLRRPGKGDPHLQAFYRTALANVALRPLLARAGLPQLSDPARLRAVQDALLQARDDRDPDWAAIGKPIGDLIDECPQSHPQRGPTPANRRVPPLAEIDRIIRACAEHLLQSFRRNGFLPAYAAFDLVGDPDFRGRDLVTALTGLDARSYKNATLLFNLARVFILGNQPIADLINPPWRGIAEPMWQPVQIRHRSAYYDAFFAEALMDFLKSGLAGPQEGNAARETIGALIRFCLNESREETVNPRDGQPISVVTALAAPPHARISRFFGSLKSNLGFGTYVPDCDTTACSLSAAAQSGLDHPMLHQPMLDFYAGYQIGRGANRFPATVAINDTIDFTGGVVTWIESAAGARPFGNDLDPTLNLDVLEVAFQNHARWGIAESAERIAFLRGIVRFQEKLVSSGAWADPRSHIYYLPELYSAYFGRCYAAFRALPKATRDAVDPGNAFEHIRRAVLAYVYDDLIAYELNPFDAALALLALAKLDGEPARFAPALDCIVQSFGEGRWRAPFKAYEWNKMKTPTRIVVGGPEVTSAFVLSALAHARAALCRAGTA